MLLLLALLVGANSIFLVHSIINLLTYLQVNSSLVFTSHNTIAYMSPDSHMKQVPTDNMPFNVSHILALAKQGENSCSDRLD